MSRVLLEQEAANQEFQQPEEIPSAGYLPDQSLKAWKVLFFAAKLCFPSVELNRNLPTK